MHSICDIIVCQKPKMENESSISFGGTTILLAIFAQNNIFGQIHFESILSHGQSHKKAV